VVAVELTDAAVPYFAYDFPRHTCLVVGHEDHGVTKRALARVDGAVFIPMFGKGASLNVHVALGVVAFHVLAHHARLEVSARSDQDAAHVPPR
jgi:tRNA (guanosine-2'-O-)-methyltransferase